MRALSEGWTQHNRPVRRASPEYVACAETYTETCHQVGGIRTVIIDLATLAHVLPPVTRQELRSGQRHEQLSKLGASAMSLLEDHDIAVARNREAMERLRAANNQIPGELL